MKNPYRWNQINLDLIYGRDGLMSEMLQSLPSVNGDSFGITGARRMGKTTLLRAVERDLLSGIEIWRDSGTTLVSIYLDGLSLPRPLTAEYLWGHIYGKMINKLADYSLPNSAGLEFSDFVEKSALLLDAQETVPKIIVIFDEIEHIIVNDWASAFFAHWRALLSNYPNMSGYFSAVFSGAIEMAALQHDIGSPLMDILQWRSLRSLTIEDTRKLACEPCKISVSDETIQLLHLETGGHPMIIQYALQKTINSASKIIGEDIINSLKDFEDNRYWQFGEWWTKYCDAASQLVYAALPDIGEQKKVSEFAEELGGYAASKAFEILQHVGIAELNSEKNSIGRRGKMFSRWQKKHGGIAQTGSYDSELAILLASLDSKFREKYVSAWAIYGQDMPNYSGAVSEMRDLVTLTLHAVAPTEAVEAQPGFKFDAEQTKPTRRQRVMFLFGKEKGEQGKAVAGDDELLEMYSVKLSGVLSKAYANASALTHTTASRPLAYQSLKQGESILAQLLTRFFAVSKNA